MPPHAYVPGRSARHPEHWFDDITASVTPEIPPHDLHNTLAFIAGRVYFDAGFYWECHEVLDPVWMQTKEPSPERDVVLAFIQLANARLKMRLEQSRAAWRLCDTAETHLSRCPTDRKILGVHVSEMLSEVISTRRAAKNSG